MNRQQRRHANEQHELIPWPLGRPLPLSGLRVGSGQQTWTCTCSVGWFHMGAGLPQVAFAEHVKSFEGRQTTVLTGVVDGGPWGTAATWSPARVPTAVDDVLLTVASGRKLQS